MKVAFLTNYFPKISETFIMNQVVGLLNRGHEVEIFALERPEEEITHESVSKYDLLDRTTYLGPPNGYVEGLNEMLRFSVTQPDMIPEVVRSLLRGVEGGVRVSTLAQFEGKVNPDFDVYHAHFGPVGKRWDFIPSITNTPFVVSFYGHDASNDLPSNPQTYEHLFDVVNTVTVLSEDMRSDVVGGGCPEELTKIVPLSVDMSELRTDPPTAPRNNKPIRILTVARFAEKKGLDDAIEAIDRVAMDYDIEWVIAGDGPLRETFEAEVRERGLTESVELLGWVTQEEVYERFDDAHLFLLPSKTAEDGNKEGTPTVLLEAQAASVPVLSTTHAGIPEIVQDGETGILVPENEPDALTKALSRFLASPEDWSKMGEKGRTFVEERHSIEAVAEQLEQLYQEVA